MTITIKKRNALLNPGLLCVSMDGADFLPSGDPFARKTPNLLNSKIKYHLYLS